MKASIVMAVYPRVYCMNVLFLLFMFWAHLDPMLLFKPFNTSCKFRSMVWRYYSLQSSSSTHDNVMIGMHRTSAAEDGKIL